MNKIDLNTLPPVAKQEMIDFYQFLLAKYTQTKEKTALNRIHAVNEPFMIAPRLVKPFKILTREELYDR